MEDRRLAKGLKKVTVWFHCDMEYISLFSIYFVSKWPLFFADLTKLFLAGGFRRDYEEYGELAEIINLGPGDGGGQGCQDLSPLDDAIIDAACLKSSSSGNPVLCGGNISGGGGYAVDTCVEYDFEIDSWVGTNYTMSMPRSQSAAVEVAGGRYWIVGGNGVSVKLLWERKIPMKSTPRFKTWLNEFFVQNLSEIGM